jgi:nicotinamidase-related amidase
MKRRNFLEKILFAGASLFTSTSFAEEKRMTGEKIMDNSMDDQKRIFKLKGEYYRHYPFDFSKGKIGAVGFKGWSESVVVEVPAEETALIAMHIWNIGFHPALPFSSEGKAGPVMEMLEWASRSIPIIKTEIPPILKATRDAKITVIHVASDEHYAKKYPGYHRILDIAGNEPSELPKAPRHKEKKPPDDIKDNLLFGAKFTDALKYYSPNFDFPELARPLDSEYVAFTAHQLNEVLRKHGIWNLIYIGFAINWCLWFSPCGMVDMSRLGYRCSCIKEAVTAVESKESAIGELHKQEALWRTSLMFGYVHSAGDFIRACGRLI